MDVTFLITLCSYSKIYVDGHVPGHISHIVWFYVCVVFQMTKEKKKKSDSYDCDVFNLDMFGNAFLFDIFATFYWEESRKRTGNNRKKRWKEWDQEM